jgi:hypothetical protein
MFGNVRHSGSFDGILIDDRKERPLTIALAMIVVVWSIVFGLTFASGNTGEHSAHWIGAATAITSPLDK